MEPIVGNRETKPTSNHDVPQSQTEIIYDIEVFNLENSNSLGFIIFNNIILRAKSTILDYMFFT